MLMLEYLFLWFLFYSFAGWVYESILVSVSERRLVNRGFLNGPICPIYGCGAVLAIVLLHDLHNPFAVFLISSIGACMLEYVTSWGMEKLSTHDGGITVIADSTFKGAFACLERLCSVCWVCSSPM